MCGNILDGAVENIMLNEKADIIYSDPPWGAGNLQYWDTMNVKMNQSTKNETDWVMFKKKFADIVNKFSKDDSHIFIEMGVRFYEDFKKVIEQSTNFKLRQIFDTKYKSGKKFLPLKIMYFTDKNQTRLPIENITGTSDDDTVRNILSIVARDNLIILDPCAGFGRTLRIANELKMRFRGVELNKKRLEKAEKYLYSLN